MECAGSLDLHNRTTDTHIRDVLKLGCGLERLLLHVLRPLHMQQIIIFQIFQEMILMTVHLKIHGSLLISCPIIRFNQVIRFSLKEVILLQAV